MTRDATSTTLRREATGIRQLAAVGALLLLSASLAPAQAGSRDPAARWQQLSLLALAMVLAMTTWFSASAVLPQLRDEWSLSTTASSWSGTWRAARSDSSWTWSRAFR